MEHSVPLDHRAPRFHSVTLVRVAHGWGHQALGAWCWVRHTWAMPGTWAIWSWSGNCWGGIGSPWACPAGYPCPGAPPLPNPARPSSPAIEVREGRSPFERKPVFGLLVVSRQTHLCASSLHLTALHRPRPQNDQAAGRRPRPANREATRRGQQTRQR